MNKYWIYYGLKILSNIFYFVLGIVLVICLYSFLSITILEKNYVNMFGFSVFQIGSNSMAPSITTNDLIIVKIGKDASENDIITYIKNNELVTHRVLEITTNSYITKGDANNTNDDTVLKEEVIGKVIKILPNYGVWYKVITTPKIIAMICITLLLFSTALSYKTKKKLTKDDDFSIYYSGIRMKKR